MSGKNPDADARVARERCELAASTRDPRLALEACDLLDQLFHAGYRLVEVAHESVTEAKPVCFELKRAEAWCAECSCLLPIGTKVWWTRGHQGVVCLECHKP